MTRPEPAAPWVVGLVLASAIGLSFVGALLIFAFPGNFAGAVDGILYGTFIAVVPLLVLAYVMRRRPAAWAFGALLMISFLSASGLLLLRLLGLANQPVDWLFGFGALVTAVILTQLVLIGWAVASIIKSRKFGGPMLGAVGMLFWPAIAAPFTRLLTGGVVVAAFLTSNRHERDLVRRVVRIQRCALLFAEANPTRGFPGSIDDMTSGATPCISAADAQPPRGAELQYHPAGRNSTGMIADFTVRARTAPDEDGDRDDIVADSRGVLVKTGAYSSLAGDAATRTDGIPFALENMRRCILSVAGDSPPPRVIDSAFADKGGAFLSGTGRPREGCSGTILEQLRDSATARRDASFDGYRMEYIGPVADTGFRLVVRPFVYGETWLRSYMATADGRIFVTREDRPAGFGDEELSPCLPEDVGDCLMTSAEAPPVAVFVHDSVIYGRKRYTLRPGVVGAPHRQPRVMWYVDCNVKPEELDDPPRDSFGSPIECSGIMDHHPLPLGDRVIVRLWMKKGELVTQMVDTIPVVRDW